MDSSSHTNTTPTASRQRIQEQERERCLCFSGHRLLSGQERATLQRQLPLLLEQLVQQGYCCFAAGGALGFDTLAAEAVLALRQRQPHIRLKLLLPCQEQEKRWNKLQQQQYHHILEQADEIIYVSDFYFQGCMHLRNRALVQCSSLCVCFLRPDSANHGGTAYTVRYAEEQGLRIINTANRLNDSPNTNWG